MALWRLNIRPNEQNEFIVAKINENNNFCAICIFTSSFKFAICEVGMNLFEIEVCRHVMVSPPCCKLNNYYYVTKMHDLHMGQLHI